MKGLLLVAATVLALATTTAAVAGAVATPFSTDRPTPLHWEQWQPPTDHADARLNAVVSVWERETTLEALLARLSRNAGVALSATENLRPQRLMIFGRKRRLSAVMLALAELYRGYWSYRRGEAPGGRTYVLTEFQTPGLAEQWIADFFPKLTGETEAERGDSLRRRLGLYQQALAMAPEAVLARFEQSDPWLCAEVLRPDTRALVDFVSGLGEERLRILTQQSTVTLTWQELGAGLQRVLRQWEEQPQGRWRDEADTETPGSAPGGGGERVVVLRWDGFMLELQMRRGGRTHQVTLVTVPPVPPGDARRALLDLGYGEATPERLEAIQREEAAWEETHRWDLVLDETPPATADDSEPRLAFPVLLQVPAGKAPTYSDLLAAAAEQRGLFIIADSPGPDESTCDLEGARSADSERAAEVTLSEILTVWHREEHGITWSLDRDRLLVTQNLPRVARDGKPMAVEEWLKWRFPVVNAFIEDLFFM